MNHPSKGELEFTTYFLAEFFKLLKVYNSKKKIFGTGQVEIGLKSTSLDFRFQIRFYSGLQFVEENPNPNYFFSKFEQ